MCIYPTESEAKHKNSDQLDILLNLMNTPYRCYMYAKETFSVQLNFVFNRRVCASRKLPYNLMVTKNAQNCAMKKYAAHSARVRQMAACSINCWHEWDHVHT